MTSMFAGIWIVGKLAVNTWSGCIGMNLPLNNLEEDNPF